MREEEEVVGGGLKEEEWGDGLLVLVVYGEVLEMGRNDWRTVFWWELPATWAPPRSPSCRPERLGEEEKGKSGKEKERYAQPTSSSYACSTTGGLTVQWVYINREKNPRTNSDSNRRPPKQ